MNIKGHCTFQTAWYTYKCLYIMKYSREQLIGLEKWKIWESVFLVQVFITTLIKYLIYSSENIWEVYISMPIWLLKHFSELLSNLLHCRQSRWRSMIGSKFWLIAIAVFVGFVLIFVFNILKQGHVQSF